MKNFRNEIVWCYNGGGVPKNEFANKHDIIFNYSKTKDNVFHTQYRPYKEGTKASSTYNKENKLDLERGSTMPDWWTDINTVTGFAPEKIGYPTQKPEALLERIIIASSNTYINNQQ